MFKYMCDKKSVLFSVFFEAFFSLLYSNIYHSMFAIWSCLICINSCLCKSIVCLNNLCLLGNNNSISAVIVYLSN